MTVHDTIRLVCAAVLLLTTLVVYAGLQLQVSERVAAQRVEVARCTAAARADDEVQQRLAAVLELLQPYRQSFEVPRDVLGKCEGLVDHLHYERTSLGWSARPAVEVLYEWPVA